MHPSFLKTNHRPWKLPRGTWRWRQSWQDLLFAHWPVAASSLQKFVPSGVTIQEFDGTSWLGIVPFQMRGVMLRPFPDLPWVSAFPELNVRLYVEVDGKPGVWFLSLDAANPLAVWAARKFFYLPYFHAQMKVSYHDKQIHYLSERDFQGTRLAFNAIYWPSSEVFEAKPASLEHFLTERYCLYTQDREGKILCAEVHHLPWPLQKAAAEFSENSIAQAQGIELVSSPLLHFSKRLDVVIWSLEQVKL